MEQIVLLLRLGLSIIFISTSVTKLRYFEKHTKIIQEFKIIKDNWINLSAILLVILEMASGICFLLGIFQFISSLVMISLLVIYNIAISINLKRGRSEISCGCGGVLGNYSLSWSLVTRNSIFIFVCAVLLNNNWKLGSLEYAVQNNRWEQFCNLDSFIIIFSSSVLTIIYLILLELINFYKQIQRLQSSIKEDY